MVRITLLAALVCACAPALGSYELALVLDRGTKKIHRFDAVSGAYFGSFGTVSSGASTMALDAARGEVIVYDSGTQYNYNYSTGILTSAVLWNSGVTKVSRTPAGTNYMVSFSTVIQEYTPSQGFLRTIPIGSALTSSVTALESNRFLVADASNKVYYGDYTSGTILSTLTFGSPIKDIAVTGMVTGAGARLSSVLLANGQVSFVATQSNGIQGTSGVLTNFGTPLGLAGLHSGMIVVGKNSAGAPLIQTYAAAFNLGMAVGLVPQTTLSGGGITDPVAVVTVIAPEPTSLAGWGLGALVLGLARRRTRSGVGESPPLHPSSSRHAGMRRAWDLFVSHHVEVVA